MLPLHKIEYILGLQDFGRIFLLVEHLMNDRI